MQVLTQRAWAGHLPSNKVPGMPVNKATSALEPTTHEWALPRTPCGLGGRCRHLLTTRGKCVIAERVHTGPMGRRGGLAHQSSTSAM